MTTERRRDERTTLLTPGQIRPATGRPVFCLVRDRSRGGAGLHVPANVAVPERFGLRLFTDGEVRPVRVVWRVGDRLGVAFEEADALDGAAPD